MLSEAKNILKVNSFIKKRICVTSLARGVLPCHYGFIFFFFICFNLSIKAQYNSEFINYHDVRRSVAVNLEFDAGSNGMTTYFTNKLLWGGHISNDDKKQS